THLLSGSTQEYNFAAGKPMTWVATEKTPEKQPMTYTLVHPIPNELPHDKKEAKDGDKNLKPKLERLGMPDQDKTTGQMTVVASALYQAGIYRIKFTDPARTDEDKTDDAEDKSRPIAVTPDLSESY